MRSDRQTGRQADRQTGRQADRQTGRQADRQTGRQADRQTGRQADRQTGRQADRQTGRQADRQTGRQADRQRQATSLAAACLLEFRPGRRLRKGHGHPQQQANNNSKSNDCNNSHALQTGRHERKPDPTCVTRVNKPKQQCKKLGASTPSCVNTSRSNMRPE